MKEESFQGPATSNKRQHVLSDEMLSLTAKQSKALLG